MEMKLAENIRLFRKQRSLTQEQLSEVLGVTVGAVHKWEAGLSIPDLRLIMEMADFFDTSVDVLLGYEVKDNRKAATALRLKEYLHSKDYTGVTEAEKALKKYPNCFEIVYGSAMMYHIFGIELSDRQMQQRALKLFGHARLLLDQNQDPTISEFTIFGEMAQVYITMGEYLQAVELMKKYNSGGIYNDLIGVMLSSCCKRPDEALPFLSEALIRNVVSGIRVVTGYLNIFIDKKDYKKAQEMILWEMKILSGLKQGKSSFLDKMEAVFYAILAKTQLEEGHLEEAKSTLKKAKKMSEEFDAAPCYDVNALRFVSYERAASAHDDLGKTAMDGVRKAVSEIKDEKLSALWEEVSNEG